MVALGESVKEWQPDPKNEYCLLVIAFLRVIVVLIENDPASPKVEKMEKVKKRARAANGNQS